MVASKDKFLKKATKGKSDWYNLPLKALEPVVDVFSYGAKQYSPGNYLKSPSPNIYYSAALRHLAHHQQFCGGANPLPCDSESCLPHLDHAICNLIILRILSQMKLDKPTLP